MEETGIKGMHTMRAQLECRECHNVVEQSSPVWLTPGVGQGQSLSGLNLCSRPPSLTGSQAGARKPHWGKETVL